MALNRTIFFDHVRKALFRGRMSQKQVDGIEAILDGWRARVPCGRSDALAYVLATAFHETAATMQPVRETLASTDATAIARLERAFAGGRLDAVKTPYWRRDEEGKTWLGRGLVQLTHRRNYGAMSALTGIDLVADPGRAMQMDVAVAILIEGMRRGSFTGKRLDDYFGLRRADWAGARRIVNGTDLAELVATYGRTFAEALRLAGC